ncbi:TonB-dependent receptor [Emticicia oligotrophica DSM 17448]|uniref:TonB-dependent receptor n=1 Tax=Emticicia oligotrophica (strain DSM 17448 / CIP 109782 / MTCC 6937 / GPTSA100-15) TaxID=929562 RepID=A0ABN4AI30_EMTOG|nr:TonB-dependent receptor [Emticicia oligotrophica]AFK01597.1 TonB-dependent receptor [Emticicia oligotrophica DSM 17448]
MKKLNLLLLFIVGTVITTFAQMPGMGGGGGGMRMGGGGFPGMMNQQQQVPQEEIPRGSAKISGKLIDSTTNKPVEFASVAVYDKNNKVVDGAMTDMNGAFTVKNLAKGTYKVVGSFIGYKNVVIGKIEIKANKEEVNVGSLLMATDTKVLNEVTVTGQAALIEDKVDRLVYNADKDITSRGGTAEDVLRKVPMLTVDMDGNVQMRGSGNIKVLINNKPSSILATNVADAIKQIPADMIKSVEVITSPSAKYDAEGTAGIINIVTKKNNLQGLTGFVNGGAGWRGANAFGNINMRKKKIGTSLNFGGNSSYNTPSNGTTSRNSSVRGVETTFNQSDESNVRRLFANTQLSIDYDINSKNSMSLSARYGLGNFNTTGVQSSLLKTISGSILQQFTQDTKNIRDNKSVDLDFNYTKTFKEQGHELAFLAQHGRNVRTTDFTNARLGLPFNKSNNDGINSESTFQLDYTYPFKKNIFEVGAKYILRDVTSNFDFFNWDNNSSSYIIQPSRTNNFSYNQDVAAAYSTLTIALPKKWGFKAGVRYENTQITAKFQTSDKPILIPAYDNIIPTVTVSKDFPKNHKIKFSYGQRIQRPSLEFLNPFVNYADPLNISYGNPLLKPELSHSFEFNYSTFFKANSINVSLFRRFTDNNITTVRSVDDKGIVTSTFDNIGKTNFYGGSVFINLQPTKNLRIGGGTNITNNLLSGSIVIPVLQTDNTYKSTVVAISNEGWNANVNFNASYTFTKGWGAQAFGFMGSRQIQLQGYQGSFRFYNLGAKKDFKNKKGSFNIGLDNPFTSSLKIKGETSDPTFKSANTRYIYNRGIRFSINYMFGKMDFNGGSMFRSKKKVSNDDAKAGEGDSSGGGAQQPAAGGGRPR